jgi:hypothetical protein
MKVGCLCQILGMLLIWIVVELLLSRLPPEDRNQIRWACGSGAALGILIGVVVFFWPRKQREKDE